MGGGLQKWNSEGMGGGVEHFGISEGKGGVKFRCHPWYGTDIFWNRPINMTVNMYSYKNNDTADFKITWTEG